MPIEPTVSASSGAVHRLGAEAVAPACPALILRLVALRIEHFRDRICVGRQQALIFLQPDEEFVVVGQVEVEPEGQHLAQGPDTIVTAVDRSERHRVAQHAGTDWELRTATGAKRSPRTIGGSSLSPSSTSIALSFKRTHVAAARVFLIVARCAALIGFEQIPVAIGTAIRIARVNSRTAW